MINGRGFSNVLSFSSIWEMMRSKDFLSALIILVLKLFIEVDSMLKKINIVTILAIVVLIIGIVLAYNWYVNFPNELAESISIYFNWG